MSNPRTLRWNFSAAVIDAAGWNVGMSLASPTTILPLFVRQLTEEPLWVGMIQAVMLFGWLVPGILVAGWVERLPRVKVSVVAIAAVERAMLLLLAPLCVWLGRTNRPALLMAFFACWGIMHACVGANTPGYYKLIAKTIPAELRGRLYGIGGAISGVLGAGTALAAGWLLQRRGFPDGYAACFLGAFAAMALSFLPVAFMREAEQPPDAVPERIGIRQALGLVRADPRLYWLGVAVALFSLNTMAGSFYALYAIQRFGAGAAAIGEYTAVQMGTRVVAYLLVGWIGDARGNRSALLISTLAGTIAAALALGAPGGGWMWAIFAWNEVATLGWGVCALNYVLELCPPERSGTYTAVYGVLSGPFRVVLPLFGGALAGSIGFPPLFAAAALGGVAALLVLLARLPEPRHGT